MNKKFSTLMAGLMLASAFSVNAQIVDTSSPYTNGAGSYQNGKYYLLGDGTDFLSVSSNTEDGSYGKLNFVKANTNAVSGLKATREALWKVTVTTGNVGDAPKFVFQNVATGLYLNISREDVDAASNDELSDIVIAGAYQEWYNGVATTGITDGSVLMSYTKADEVIYFTESNGKIVAKLAKPSVAEADANKLKVEPYKAAIVKNLTADELNKELLAKATADVFNLTFNKDVTEGAENLFSKTALQAVQMYTDASGVTEATETTGDTKKYVRLHVKDTENYIVVDTALHTGSEAERQLPKFAYDDPAKNGVDYNNVNRLSESFNFAFSYLPFEDRLLIQSEAYYTRAYNKNTGKWAVGPVKGDDNNTAYSGWGDVSKFTTTPSWFQAGDKIKDAYVRLVELSSVRELTVASENEVDDNSKTQWTEYDNLTYGMNTTVTLGQGLLTYQPTSLDEGLYLIKLSSNAKRTDATAGDYFIANLGGKFGYAEQAKNQDYDHMPAAQWYVKKNGNTDTAPISITNREFTDTDLAHFAQDEYFQAFKTEDGKYFFVAGGLVNGTARDTVEFIPVSAASKADKYLGYKHVNEAQASVEIYNFNYLHGLSLDNGLNTPLTDSLVRVDETGEKAAFRLIPVVESDSYGIQLDEKKTGIANLVRNVYYVQAYDNSKFEGTRYLNYDEASKKYVMSTTKQPFFLKENNDVDGTHYYALVEANFLNKTLSQAASIILGKDQTVSDLINFYSPEYAGVKVADAKSYAKIYGELTGDAKAAYEKSLFFPLDENGQMVVTDNSNVALYAYQAYNGTVTLRRISIAAESGTTYYYLNPATANDGEFATNASEDYASERVSVDDNTLDLTRANIEDKWVSEIRVSAFDAKVIDSPLYRRFNGVAPETYGDAANAPLNLKFFRYNNPAEYLFENYSSENKYRDGINDKSISFLGVNNAYQFEETATRSYTMFVDTAYVRNNTRMPQYLIAVKPEVVEGDTILCDASTHQHKTPEEALASEHTQIKVGFTRAMYLFNAQDSVDVKNYDYQGKAAYGADKYTRLAFKDAVHAQDTLYILNPGVTTEQLIAGNFKNEDLFADKIALDNNKHKNVVFQFRLIDDENNRFLIESESDPEMIAPEKGGWIKIQNGVPVIARFDTFKEAIAQAEIFDVNDEIKYDATANDEIAVEGVSVVAGDGQITIMGAAGKNVTITNILGKVVASQVIASDNATIAVPAGIVAVAVEGEAAVKAIVK